MRAPSGQELRKIAEMVEVSAEYYNEETLLSVAEDILRIAHEVEARELGIGNALAP